MTAADLDHVALAAARQGDLWPRYAGDLGGVWAGGGPTVGFEWAQVRFANGMRLEVLEPRLVEQNDFLWRFLDRNGAGPHHVTFKVPDIGAALAELEDAGYRPVGVNLSDPNWKEAFVHPKDGPGIVVQVAESGGSEPESVTPAGFPPARDGRTATLVHVAHAVARLETGLGLFAGLLGGAESGGGGDAACEWVDLAWPGPGRLRLVAPRGPGPLADWLGPRSGRFHHLAFVTHDPGRMAGSRPLATAGVWVVEPADNQGTRLVVAEDAGAFAPGPLGYAG